MFAAIREAFVAQFSGICWCFCGPSFLKSLRDLMHLAILFMLVVALLVGSCGLQAATFPSFQYDYIRTPVSGVPFAFP